MWDDNDNCYIIITIWILFVERCSHFNPFCSLNFEDYVDKSLISLYLLVNKYKMYVYKLSNENILYMNKFICRKRT